MASSEHERPRSDDGTRLDDGARLDADAAARRKLLKIGIYSAPAIIGTLLLSPDAHAAPPISCSPATCKPSPCSPRPCAPTPCAPNPCAPTPCGPSACKPYTRP